MRKLAQVLAGVATVAILPGAAALLQGCADCSSARSFDLDLDAEGVYRLCEGGEHAFEQLEAERVDGGGYDGLRFEIVPDVGAALQVSFGDNDLTLDGDRVLGDTRRQGCNVVQDNDPLIITASSEVEYELMLSTTACPDE